MTEKCLRIELGYGGPAEGGMQHVRGEKCTHVERLKGLER